MNFDSTKGKLVKSSNAKGAIVEIVKWHNAANKHLRDTWAAHIKCGELLIAQQDKVGHGNWIQWVEKNLPFGRLQAWRYMRCYEQRRELNVSSKEHLTLENVARIAAQTEPKAIVAELVEEPVRSKVEFAEDSTYAQPVILGGRPLVTMPSRIPTNIPKDVSPNTADCKRAQEYLALACRFAQLGGLSGDELLERLISLLPQFNLAQTQL